MPGAAVLAARGALRGGAGLVRVVTPSQIAPVVVSQIPSATCSAYHVDAVGAAEPSAAVAALDDALSLGSSSLVVGCAHSAPGRVCTNRRHACD
jgi:NAD(P)H-hydrate repair Nnr-like enzyme with NAD(P)H-hydrate dehydratase domain